jgi:hypothetical protein
MKDHLEIQVRNLEKHVAILYIVMLADVLAHLVMQLK